MNSDRVSMPDSYGTTFRDVKNQVMYSPNQVTFGKSYFGVSRSTIRGANKKRNATIEPDASLSKPRTRSQMTNDSTTQQQDDTTGDGDAEAIPLQLPMLS